VPRQTPCTQRLVALSLGSPRTRLGVRLLATLATAAGVTSCDSQSRNAQLDRGWVTNCVGPEFRKFAENGHEGPGAERPVFKINDQLLLAVRKEYSPRSVNIDHAPRTCTRSAIYPRSRTCTSTSRETGPPANNPSDQPLVLGADPPPVQPDKVIVRNEPKESLPAEQRREIEESRRKALRQYSPAALGGRVTAGCRRRETPNPSRPVPSNSRLAGSGIVIAPRGSVAWKFGFVAVPVSVAVR
jgi:hypothetical protein